MKGKSPLKKSPVIVAGLISLGMFIIIFTLRNMRCLEFFELSLYDQYLRWQPKVSSPDPYIILINVSEKDIQKLGQWPLSDGILAEALTILLTYQPRAIGLDMYRDIPVPPGGDQLAAVFAGHAPIVAVKKIGDENYPGVPSPYMLTSSDLVGFNDILVDPGGVVRRGLFFLDDGKTSFYSFALLLALLYLESENIVPRPDLSNSQHLRLGKTTFVPFSANDGGYIKADARGYQFLLDYRRRQDAFRTFFLTDVLSGQVSPQEIQDKIVIIGVTAESLKDFFFTPFSRRPESGRMSGIELHAHMASQIIHSSLHGSRTKKSMGERYEWGWIALWCLAGGLFVVWKHSFFRFLLVAISGLLFLTILTYLVFTFDWWIPIVPSAFGFFLSAGLVTAYISHREKVQKTVLMQLFSKHVSKDVAESIWQQRDFFMDGGRPRTQKLVATVLFTDLQGFTAISESLNPQVLLDWLNEYMEAMARIIIDHDGVINKFIGDAIMAVFGIPLPRTDEIEIRRDAVKAVECALAMSSEIGRLNVLWQRRNLPTTRMRVGIFTGPLVAGSLGSSHRMEYTVIGDTVNIASRLEGFNKDVIDTRVKNDVCRVLIGQETFRFLGSQFQTEMIGQVNLKGKTKKITIYRVIVPQTKIIHQNPQRR